MAQLQTALLIVEIVLAFIKGEIGTGPKMAAGEAWLRIAGAAAGAYQAEVGQPLDPAKVQPYIPIP